MPSVKRRSVVPVRRSRSHRGRAGRSPCAEPALNLPLRGGGLRTIQTGIAMKLFLSYPSAQRALAERLMLALESEDHDVFMDRSDLRSGEAFHQRLREAVARADAMVFLITPEAVAAGSYCLTELGYAQEQWRRPSGRVLPVMVVPTPIAALPAYLSAVTVLAPRGEIVAEVVAAAARLRASGTRTIARVSIAAVALLAVAIGGGLWWQARQRDAADAALALAQAASARELCRDGSHEAALAQLSQAAQLPSAPPSVRSTEEDCAMQWLRDMRTTGQQTFAEQVARVQPILSNALAQASGVRAADLRAHIGWGEYLRGRDGVAANDPVPHWKRALGDDPANPYAHSMWARRLLDSPVDVAAAKLHFAQAVAAKRDLRFVRALQFGGAIGRFAELDAYAVTVADEMRRSGETVATRHRERLWTYAFGSNLLDPAYRAAVLAALAPADLLATFLWLYPQSGVAENQRYLWRFSHATLLAHAGDTAKARQGFEALAGELRAARAGGRLLDQADAALARLTPSAAPTPPSAAVARSR